MSEWKEFTIEDFAVILNHKRIPLSSTERSIRKGNFPYYGASGVIDAVDDFIFDGEHVLISEDGENLKSRQTPIAFLANGRFWVNNHAHILKGKKDFHNKLIVHYFSNLDLNPFITGAVQPKLNKASLQSIPIYLPDDEDEQKSIASILSSLDDKIDLLNRQNATLEKMAETLFRQWFVEEAKEEWEEVELGSVIETTSGGTPSRTNLMFYEHGTISWVKSKELKGSFILETEEKITKEALIKSSAKILPAHSVLIAMYGATVGEYAIISKEMTCNQAICALKPNNDYPYSYLYLLIKSNKEELINMAVGSAQQNISQLLIKQLPVLNCTDRIKEFNLVVESHFAKIKSNRSQICTLRALRDSLLPKLMSGEVKVKDIKLEA